MELPLNYWLETIADKQIRESALEQWDKEVKKSVLTGHAIGCFANWPATKEGKDYWDKIYDQASAGTLPLREVTIEGLRFNTETRGWEPASTPQPKEPSVAKQILLALVEAEEHAGNNKFISPELRIYAQSKSAKLREIAEKL